VKPKKLFPDAPVDVTKLTDEQLTTALDAHVAIVKAVRDGDEDTLADLDAGELTAQLEAGVVIIEQLRAEQGVRTEAATEAATRVAELAKRAGLEDDAADADKDADADADKAPEGEGADKDADADADADKAPDADADADADKAPEGEGAETPELALAAAADRRRRVPARRALPAAKGPHKPQPQPQEAGERRATITAGGDIPGFSTGMELADGDAIARAMVARHDSLGRAVKTGDNIKVPVATIRAAAEPERTLGTDEQSNMLKINAVTSRRALAASGGICAPATPYYGLMELAVADRPVRDSLPRFNADRGAIRFATPPGLSIVDDAIGYITAEEDGEGGTFALKSCQAVVCPDINEVDVAIIYHCTQFGNLGARTWPEQVAQFNELVLAAHARLAEQALLDGIAAASTAVTGAIIAGATGTILGQIITAAAGYRSRQRMNQDAQLRVMLPAWVLDALQVDVLRSQFARFDNTDATFTQQLAQANVTPTWYMDTPTGAGQVFPAQSGSSPLDRFPATCVWFLFAEGSFMYVDGGVLELGIVRDSTLNSHNDYQIFGETFENVAFLGLESIECTSTFCANGVTTAPAVAPSCAA
jgi:hypothetical protein